MTPASPPRDTQRFASWLPEFHQLDWRGYLDDDWDELVSEASEAPTPSHPTLECPCEWLEHLRQMSDFRRQLRQLSEQFRQRTRAVGACS